MQIARALTLLVVLAAGCSRTTTPRGREDAITDEDTVPEGDEDQPPDQAMECPEGFVAIRGSEQLGTTDFCVMQFEAKAWLDANADGAVSNDEIVPDGCSEGCVPVSAATGTPWRSLSQADAYATCATAGYALMSNREWMTIARSAEANRRNWTTGTVGRGRMFEGNTTGGYAGADILDPYAGTSHTANDSVGNGFECRRTLILEDGTVIWDMPGNVQEWIDWTTGEPLDGPPTCNTNDLSTFACSGVANDDFNAATGSYDRTFGVGIVIGGSGGAARRGGQSGDHGSGFAGAFALNMNRDPTFVNGSTGFRCVLRSSVDTLP